MRSQSTAAPLLMEEQPATQTVEPVRDVALVPATTVEPEPVSMIERLAKDPAVDVEKLQRLIDMQRDAQRHQAEAAFNAAFADLQADLPTITERASTDKTTYAPIEDIVEAVRPVLKRHGFSLSFRTEWPEKGVVKVVGILTHRDGHARQSEFQAAADQTGSKNAIQAFGSSVSYGRRYTTTDLLCIVSRKATGARDDDGEGSERPAPPDGFAAWWQGLQAAAARGLKAFEPAWECSEAAFKNYAMKHQRQDVNALKRTAASIKQGVEPSRGGR